MRPNVCYGVLKASVPKENCGRVGGRVWKEGYRKDGGGFGGISGDSTRERKGQVHPPGLIWVSLTGLL